MLKVLYPNGRDIIETGTNVPIRWSSTTAGTVRVSVWTGSRWVDSIGDVPAQQGSLAWNVPQDFPLGNLYRVRVELLPTAAIRDYSDGYFTIKRFVAAPPPGNTAVTPPPPGLGIDYGFYKKYLSSTCGHIVSSANVSDQALLAVKSRVEFWLTGRDDLQNKLRSFGHRFIVIGKDEGQTTPPEYRNLNREFPLTFPGGWDARARGLGGDTSRHYTSCGEENLLGLSVDRYKGEDVLLHEFGHTIHALAANYVIPSFDSRLKAAWLAATTRDGLWLNTYAGSNHKEYWAEGVQTWFEGNMHVTSPNGVHNQINTRAELYNYDRNLYNLLDEVYAV